VLFRPLTKLRVVTAVKNILDPAETTRVDMSGFPDAVVLVQISETNEVAAPAPATIATASTSEQNKAGAAPSSNTTAAAVITVKSDEGPAVTEPNAKKPKIATESSTPPVAPSVAAEETPCVRVFRCFHGVGKARWVLVV
jgi:hypothetical protein